VHVSVFLLSIFFLISNLILIKKKHNFLIIIQIDSCWTPWISGFVVFIKLRNVWLLFIQMPFCIPRLRFQSQVCQTGVFPQVTRALFIFSLLFSLSFILGSSIAMCSSCLSFLQQGLHYCWSHPCAYYFTYWFVFLILSFGFCFFCQYWSLNKGLHALLGRPATLPARFGYSQDSILQAIFPGWLWTMILLISASWVARITGVSHRRWLHIIFFNL
jgi:hypothetical protein